MSESDVLIRMNDAIGMMGFMQACGFIIVILLLLVLVGRRNER